MQIRPTTRPSTSKNAMAVALIALSSLTGVSAWAQKAPGRVAEGFVPGRILVTPRAGMNEAALARILRDHGAQQGRRVGGSELRIVDVTAGNERALADRLSRHPLIKFAEVDRLIAPGMATSDPYLGSAWHLSKIGAPTAWDTSLGAGITVAILDTGVDGTHPDLAPLMVAGWNFFDNNSNTADVYGHGTKVAGAAAAAANNGIGVAGVAGNAKIMPIRISDSAGYGSLGAMAQGLVWAADRGARVANISYVSADSKTVTDAAAYMKSKGGLVTTAAGNYAMDMAITPTTSMIPVSSTGSGDTLSGWSSWGSFVAMAAPGEGIYTTVVGGGYGAVSGTSFASPVTAGVIALMMGARPTLSAAKIESLLYSTALDLGSAGRDAYYGYGRVNAAAAVSAAMQATETVDSTAPSASIAAPLAASTVAGVVPVDVSAADNVAVSRVDLIVNGKIQSSSVTAPYVFAWDSASVANGTASIKAQAYDLAGNMGSSSTVSVTVANYVAPDTLAPGVTITSPANGASLRRGSIKIQATSTDNVAVASQTLTINGTVMTTVSGGAMNYTWNARKAAVGGYQITVRAVDAAGNSAASTSTVTLR